MIASLPQWTMPGIVSDLRELKTKEKKEVWAYSVTVLATGGTFEMQTKDVNVFKSVGQGEEIIATGHFEQYQGNLKLVVTSFKKANGKGGA